MRLLDRWGHPTSGHGLGILPGLAAAGSVVLAGASLPVAWWAGLGWGALLGMGSAVCGFLCMAIWIILENRRERIIARLRRKEERLRRKLDRHGIDHSQIE